MKFVESLVEEDFISFLKALLDKVRACTPALTGVPVCARVFRSFSKTLKSSLSLRNLERAKSRKYNKMTHGLVCSSSFAHYTLKKSGHIPEAFSVKALIAGI